MMTSPGNSEMLENIARTDAGSFTVRHVVGRKADFCVQMCWIA